MITQQMQQELNLKSSNRKVDKKQTKQNKMNRQLSINNPIISWVSFSKCVSFLMCVQIA